LILTILFMRGGLVGLIKGLAERIRSLQRSRNIGVDHD